jgi:hypothetical protein
MCLISRYRLAQLTADRTSDAAMRMRPCSVGWPYLHGVHLPLEN